MRKMDVEKLIEQVRVYPALYDPNNEKYKNTEYRDRVWQKIAETLEVADEPAACKTKWIHVRDQFRKTLKKRKTATGLAAKRKYKYEDALQFLLPQLSERKTCSNVSLSQIAEGYFDDYDSDESQKVTPNENASENNATQGEPPTTVENVPTTSSNIPKSKDSFVTPDVHKKKKKVNKTIALETSPSSQLMAYILKEKKNEKQKEIPSLPEKLHPVDAFLNGISPTLKALCPLHLNEAKSRIFGIVQEFEMKEILENQQIAYSREKHIQLPQTSPLSSQYTSDYSPTPYPPSPSYNVLSPQSVSNFNNSSTSEQSKQNQTMPYNN